MPSTQNINPNSILVNQAGIVLLQSYIPILLARLELTQEQKFINTQSQHQAVNSLCNLASGQNIHPQQPVPLLNLLCGLPISTSIDQSTAISEDHTELIGSLISAAISYWHAIGNCSINGFRGNWLIRDGLLTEQEDKYELSVQKRAYDVLISQSPFTFSIIKFPWMQKPLYVKWPI